MTTERFLAGPVVVMAIGTADIATRAARHSPTVR